MPDDDLSPRARITLRVLRALMYLASGASGVLALIWTPTLARGEPSWAGWLWAPLVIMSSAVALAGVVMDRYRVEWIAIWWVCLGVLIATLLEIASAQYAPWLRDGAALDVALVGALLYRTAELSAHASKLRHAHLREGRR